MLRFEYRRVQTTAISLQKDRTHMETDIVASYATSCRVRFIIFLNMNHGIIHSIILSFISLYVISLEEITTTGTTDAEKTTVPEISTGIHAYKIYLGSFYTSYCY